MFMTQEEFGKLPKDQQDLLMKKIEEIQSGAGAPPVPKGLAQLTMDEFKGMVGQVIKDHISSMTHVDKKYFAFPGIGKVDDDISPEGKFSKTVKFLKALAGGDVQTCKTMSNEVRVKANLSEGSTSGGGFLVPEEFASEILRLAPTYGVIRQNCRIIPMSSDVKSIPKAGGTELTAQWVNEAGQIKSTDPTFGQVQLIINKLAAIPVVTSELLADANIDVIAYLSELIAEAFAYQEDYQGFNGTGSPFVGILGATGVPTYPLPSGTGFICLSYPDLVKSTTELYDAATANAKFYLHRTIIGHLRGLITTAGAPIILPTAKDFAGFPFVSTEVLPGTRHSTANTDATQFMVFGDLRKTIAMGQRAGIEMKISDQATVGSNNLFEKDMQALRMIERVSFGVLLPSASLIFVS